MAAEFAAWSTYTYVLDNPVAFVDPDGKAPADPIYGKYGRIIAYRVEAGQGPTQIAQDLNQYYSCALSCEADWTQIVYDNAEQFENVLDGDGNIEDKYNGDYESGNIEPGDILQITIGAPSELENKIVELEGEIENLKGVISSAKSQRAAIYRKEDEMTSLKKALSQYDNKKQDGGLGGNAGFGRFVQTEYGLILGSISRTISDSETALKEKEEQLQKIKTQ